jgi:hypothetical protein
MLPVSNTSKGYLEKPYIPFKFKEQEEIYSNDISKLETTFHVF